MSQLKKPKNVLLWIIGLFVASPMLISLLAIPIAFLLVIYQSFKRGQI